MTAEVPVAVYPSGQGRTRPGPRDRPGHHPPLRRRRPKGRGCWCPGGRSGPNAASTCATAKAAPAPPPPAPRNPGSAARGGGASTAQREKAGPGTCGGSGRPSTKRETVISWAVEHRVGTLAVGDPRGVLHLKAGRHHAQRTRDWRIGHLIRALADKAEAAGITVHLADERGTSSTCPRCARRVPKPAGRNFSCPHCGQGGHRNLSRPPASPPGPLARQHPRRPQWAGDHAPSRRNPPARCAPRAA